MIWVYIVVLSFTNIDGSTFTVQAPNLTFRSEEICQLYRIHSMTRLLKTRPNKNAKAISQCFSLPFEIKSGVAG